MREQLQKKFFAHFQSHKRLQHGIAVLQDSRGKKITDSQTKAYLFSNVYAMSYRSDNGAEPPPFFRDAVQIDPIVISNNVVESALASLNIIKSAGPDSLHPRILTLYPLGLSFDLTLETVDIPEDRREATVCPIFKKGCKGTPGNYHHVSLTSIVCKMMETILKSSLMKHLQQTASFSTAQHGFVPKSSVSPTFY